ncbi:MarR family winged helix-turn-helix transcriptional regulator [Alkaliphilus transvaalensis]|uniref:MarR family winged helix-turn-helix transcriptional regulator n=1 Tax=Alkaliphilus transvaalensis TaxID=114628 RepID=UPI00047E80C4|nr:MarR family transcriptional regulator [Alkaliphilus transvaalensis]
MRNYYLEIQQYLEKFIYNVIILDKKGIKNNGDSLSMTEILILKTLGDQKEKKMSDIIEEFNIDRNTFGTIVTRLQSQNYIIKKKSLEDKRVQVLLLTDKGKQAFEQILLKEKDILFTLLNDFTFNEEKAILKFLVKIDLLKKNTGLI